MNFRCLAEGCSCIGRIWCCLGHRYDSCWRVHNSHNRPTVCHSLRRSTGTSGQVNTEVRSDYGAIHCQYHYVGPVVFSFGEDSALFFINSSTLLILELLWRSISCCLTVGWVVLMHMYFVTLWVILFYLFFFLTDLSIDSVVPRAGEKDKLDVASGPEYYHEVHQKYHPTCSREKGWTEYSLWIDAYHL